MPVFCSQNTVVTECDLIAGVSVMSWLVQLSMVVEVYFDPCLSGVLGCKYTLCHTHRGCCMCLEI